MGSQNIKNGAVTDAKLATRTVRGGVTSAGAVSFGTGFSVVRNSAGNYTVTFSTAFSATPAVVVSLFTGAAVGIIRVIAQSASSFQVVTSDTAFTGTDAPFNFIAESV